MTRTPRATRILNAVLAPATKGRQDPETAWAKAVAQVEQAARISDRPFADDLGRIVVGATEISRLSPLGWALILSDVKGRYTNRLRVQRILTERPEIRDEPITAPVVVCGLPRTATTLAHRVISASPDHRAPLLWEMTTTGLADPTTERRSVRQLEQMTRVMTNLAPGIPRIHPIHATRPEESMFLLPHGSYWPILHGLMPSYSAWSATRDVTGDYEYLKACLQVLQYGRDPKRWILKYPAHLADMDTILKVFPDATFVWTHRDPATVIGSACSLAETFWRLYQHDADRGEIGQFILRHLRAQVDRGLQLRMELPPSAIVDVPYHQLAADPLTEVPRLYAAIGATWTATDEANLVAVVAKPTGTPSHQYDAGVYLDPDQIHEAFAPYQRLLDRLDLRDATPTVEL